MKLAAASILGLAWMATARSEPVAITLWGADFGPNTKGFEAMVREFERRNPDVRVRVLSMGAGKMNPQKLMTAIVGNVAPDVVKQDRFTIGDWASRSAFRSLSPLLARDRQDPLCPREEEYYPAPWAEASYRGEVYAIPESADNRVLYYNKRFFRESAAQLRAAGLDPDRPPRTWTELVAYGKAMTRFDRNGRLVRAGFMPNFGNCWLYLYAFQNNADFLSADGRTCTMDTPEAAEALQFMVDAYRPLGGYEAAKAFESGFQQNANDAFVTGKVAMKIDGDWIIKDLARYAPSLELGTAPAPVPDDRFFGRGRFGAEPDRFVTWSGGFSWAIPKGARHAEEGWRFIKFATSVEGRTVEAMANRDWQRRQGREFVVPVSGNRLFNERALREFPPRDPKFAAALQTHVEMSKFARTRPVTFVGQKLWDEQVRATERACSGAVPVREALRSAQANVQAELDAAARFESYPPYDERLPIYLSAAIGVGLLAVLAVAYRRAPIGKLGRHEARWAYLFLSPWLIGFFAWVLGPMVASFLYSFTAYNVMSPARSVGWANYAAMAGPDWPNVAKAFWNAVYLAGVGVPLGIVTGLALALLLNAGVAGMRAYRTFFYMPAIVPGTASAVLWLWLLNASPDKGLINSAWQATITDWFQVPPPTWMNSESWSKPALILQGLWGAGGGMLLWLAGLKGIPRSLYEAAEIDGASAGRQFWAVTVPMLSPIIFFNTVMGFIGSVQEFDRVYVMKPSEGSVGPNDSLLSPVYHLFQNGFGYFKMGYASALAWATFAVILALTLAQLQLKSRWVYEEVGT